MNVPDRKLHWKQYLPASHVWGHQRIVWNRTVTSNPILNSGNLSVLCITLTTFYYQRVYIPADLNFAIRDIYVILVVSTPYAPCMEYSPTFGSFMVSMLVNIAYMECMGTVSCLFHFITSFKTKHLGSSASPKTATQHCKKSYIESPWNPRPSGNDEHSYWTWPIEIVK